jgi:pyruvate dehydrogenase (quinone)
VVLEAITDPEVPPLPPHIRPEQAKNMARALAKGDPARGRIMREALKGKLKELTTR